MQPLKWSRGLRDEKTFGKMKTLILFLILILPLSASAQIDSYEIIKGTKYDPLKKRQSGRSNYPNARYNVQKERLKRGLPNTDLIPKNQIMFNIGNALVNEVQLSYYRRLGMHWQPFISGGMIRPAGGFFSGFFKGVAEMVSPHKPFWSMSEGWSLATGVNWIRQPGKGTDYWGITLFYRNLSYKDEYVYYYTDPFTGSSYNTSNELDTKESFQRHVFGIKLTNGYQFPRRKKSSFRGQVWWGLGLRYREDRHYNLTVLDSWRHNYPNQYTEHALLPSIQLGLNLGFGW